MALSPRRLNGNLPSAWRGLGDWASDAYLGTSVGQAALAAAQAAAAKLPAGFTMGDPTSDMWGASYYNGKKVISTFPPYYGLEDGSNGPAVSDAINQAIENAANAAYAVYNYIYGLRGSTNPAMVAVLSDPEWINLQGKTIDWNSLSTELQNKIKAVPNLYNQLTAGLNLATETPPPPPPPPSAPTGPAMYLVAGILFDANGVVYNQSNHQPTGETLTSDEVHSLLTTGQLPAGSPPLAPQSNSPSPVPAPVSVQPAAPSPPSSIPSTGATSSPAGTSLATPAGSGGAAAIPAPTGGATDVGGNMSAANPSMSIAAPSPAGGGQGTTTPAPALSELPPWMLYGALAVVAIVAIRGSKR